MASFVPSPSTSKGARAKTRSLGKKNAKFADADNDSVPSFHAILDKVRAVIKAKISRFRNMMVEDLKRLKNNDARSAKDDVYMVIPAKFFVAKEKVESRLTRQFTARCSCSSTLLFPITVKECNS